MKMRRYLTVLILIFAFSLSAIPIYAIEGGSKGEGEAIKITSAQFKALIMDYENNTQEWKYKGELPCVIDFYADWCAPCRQAAPVLEELALKYKGKIKVYKVNTDQEKELSSIFGISGIPAFLWVPMEGKPTMTSGVARSPEEIKTQFEKMINGVLLKE